MILTATGVITSWFSTVSNLGLRVIDWLDRLEFVSTGFIDLLRWLVSPRGAHTLTGLLAAAFLVAVYRTVNSKGRTQQPNEALSVVRPPQEAEPLARPVAERETDANLVFKKPRVTHILERHDGRLVEGERGSPAAIVEIINDADVSRPVDSAELRAVVNFQEIGTDHARLISDVSWLNEAGINARFRLGDARALIIAWQIGGNVHAVKVRTKKKGITTLYIRERQELTSGEYTVEVQLFSDRPRRMVGKREYKLVTRPSLQVEEVLPASEKTDDKSEEERLKEIAEYDKKNINKVVRIVGCKVNYDKLIGDAPSLDFTFEIFNGSFFDISIDKEVGNFIHLNDKALTEGREIVGIVENLPRGEVGSLTITQRVSPTEAALIRKASERDAFRLAGLRIVAKGGTNHPEVVWQSLTPPPPISIAETKPPKAEPILVCKRTYITPVYWTGLKFVDEKEPKEKTPYAVVAEFVNRPNAKGYVPTVEYVEAQMTFYDAEGEYYGRVAHGYWLGHEHNHCNIAAGDKARLVIAVGHRGYTMLAMENHKASATMYESKDPLELIGTCFRVQVYLSRVGETTSFDFIYQSGEMPTIKIADEREG